MRIRCIFNMVLDKDIIDSKTYYICRGDVVPQSSFGKRFFTRIFKTLNL